MNNILDGNLLESLVSRVTEKLVDYKEYLSSPNSYSFHSSIRKICSIEVDIKTILDSFNCVSIRLLSVADKVLDLLYDCLDTCLDKIVSNVIIEIVDYINIWKHDYSLVIE